MTGYYAGSDGGRLWTSALGRKRSLDACTTVVRHNALHGGTTIRGETRRT